MPDFFAPEFREAVEEKAKKVEEHVGDPMIVGYYLDNELPWAPDHNHMPELFDGCVALAADAPGKQRFVAFMQERYETVEAFNKVWKPKLKDWAALAEVSELKRRNKKKAKADREDFTLEIARQYFKVTTEAIRTRDPGRLILGCRLMPYTVPKVVVGADFDVCSGYLRVPPRSRSSTKDISVGHFGGAPSTLESQVSTVVSSRSLAWPG